MSGFMSCDCCGRMTNRLHHGVAYGTDYSACDACCSYDHEAYDEPEAEYEDDPQEAEYAAREPDPRDTP